jgi:hypothetical protein
MPTPYEILQGLETIANQMSPLAIIWHIALVGMLIGFIAGWRPTVRFVRIALTLLLLSVSAMAWLFGNPFNGAVFLFFAIFMISFGLKPDHDKISFNFGWAGIVGIIMTVFGLIYPHFLHTDSLFPYLYRSPVGLVPCPTLSFIIGLALILDNLRSRGWYIMLIGAGMIYGIVGAFRLAVTADLVLLAGAILLTINVFITGKPTASD